MPKPEAPDNSEKAPKGTDPVKTEDASQDKGFDTSALSDEDFAKVYDDDRLYNHNRFKDLRGQAKEAEELKASQKESEEKKLKEDGKLKELLEKKESEIEDMKKTTETVSLNNAIQQALFKESTVDSDAALKLMDRSSIDTDENGEYTGIDTAIESLKESKPYLFGQGNTNVGAGSNPQPGEQNGTKTFKRSQLQDSAFFQENKEEIIAAQKAGTIIDDLSSTPI